MAFKVPNEHRLRSGLYGSDDSLTDGGAFMVPGPSLGPSVRPNGRLLRVIAGVGFGWEHVSVSVDAEQRCPTWEEMDHVKRMFWDDSDCVAQLHVPRSDWINMHPYTLHLWRQVGHEWARPASWMVGFKNRRG